VATPVKFGVFVPQGWKMDLVEIADPVEKFEAMTAVGKLADDSNFDSIWVYDHFHTVPTPEIETTFECWTITSTLARDTKRVKIGQMVGCNGYRNPALYAKIASTVDVASHGRLYAGIGAGWYEHEWKAYGYEWNDIPVRMAKFREAVQIIHKMWTEERPVFQGKHYSINGPINEPKGVQKPHVPLWIGGGGEQVTLKLVAQYANACNVGGGNPDVIRQKLDILKRHCDTVGRDYDEITKSTSADPLILLEKESDADAMTAKVRGDVPLDEFLKRAWVGTPERIAERLRTVFDAGANYIIIKMPRVAYEHDQLQRFSREVIPLFS
jgi:F420-dependent oxidoreductase-like protein